MIDVQLHNMQKIITHPNGAEKVCVCGGGVFVWHWYLTLGLVCVPQHCTAGALLLPGFHFEKPKCHRPAGGGFYVLQQAATYAHTHIHTHICLQDHGTRLQSKTQQLEAKSRGGLASDAKLMSFSLESATSCDIRNTAASVKEPSEKSMPYCWLSAIITGFEEECDRN